MKPIAQAPVLAARGAPRVLDRRVDRGQDLAAALEHHLVPPASAPRRAARARTAPHPPRARGRGSGGAERRLRDAQPFGRAAEVQLLGDGDEIAKVPELHATDLYRRRIQSTRDWCCCGCRDSRLRTLSTDRDDRARDVRRRHGADHGGRGDPVRACPTGGSRRFASGSVTQRGQRARPRAHRRRASSARPRRSRARTPTARRQASIVACRRRRAQRRCSSASTRCASSGWPSAARR